MARDTRWVWIPMQGEGWVLAYTYVDPQAGPSAKGGLVREPLTPEQIKSAIETPGRTFRDPAAFGARAIGAEDAARYGLPGEPPWIGFFEKKQVAAPTGEPVRSITAIVTRGGAPVAGARVRMGESFGDGEPFDLDEGTTDAGGRCVFPELPKVPIAALAEVAGARSCLVEVPDGDDAVHLPLFALGALEGTTRRLGVPVQGDVSMKRRGGTERFGKYGDASGSYRVAGVLPGTYDVEVRRVHPETRMSAGTATCDVIEILEGQTLRRDYTLAAGVTVDITIPLVNRPDDWAEAVLFRGRVAPRTSLEVGALIESLRGSGDRSGYQSANTQSKAKDNSSITIQFLDAVPGTHTLCVSPHRSGGKAHREQPVVCREITAAEEPISVSIELPPLRPA